MTDPIRVAAVTNIIPVYRRDYYRRIFNNPLLDVTVFCQNKIPGMNLISIHREFGKSIVEVPYKGAKREVIGWQCLPWRRLLSGYDVYFIHGNPRVLSNIVVSMMLILMGKVVVIEGQLHTAGSRKLFEAVRLSWWRLFRYIYLYNDNEVHKIRKKVGFGRKILVGMNNGLNQELVDDAIAKWPSGKLAAWQIESKLDNHTVVLSCARLEAKNHFDLMVNCLPDLLNQFPNLLWCVIGDGPEKDRLEACAARFGVSHAIRWLGPIYEEEQLAPWFLTAKILVHPGAIGLSLLHAFGYGLPVVTHNNESQHMPEYSCLKNGVNGIVHRFADLDEMVKAIISAIQQHAELSNNTKQTVVENFNTRIMAQRFQYICQLAANNATSGDATTCG